MPSTRKRPRWPPVLRGYVARTRNAFPLLPTSPPSCYNIQKRPGGYGYAEKAGDHGERIDAVRRVSAAGGARDLHHRGVPAGSDARLLLLLETLCATGIRVSELQYITVEAAQNGVAEIALKGKIRTILLPTKLCRKLLTYAKKRNICHGQIFLTRNGNGLSRKFIWSEMKELCEGAQVARSKVFPHNLRGLFARTLYAACRDVVRLADVLGHSSIETTRIYLLSTAKESARQLDRLGLLSGWT